MKFSFKATIQITGINPYVDVPGKITKTMKPVKGYIPISGKINKHGFIQTLVPVKNAPYRLFVNGPMLKGSGTKLGDTVRLIIEQDETKREEPFPGTLKETLKAKGLLSKFEHLTPARKKEVLRYLNNLKTEESRQRNIEKLIIQLTKTTGDNKGFLRVFNPSPR